MKLRTILVCSILVSFLFFIIAGVFAEGNATTIYVQVYNTTIAPNTTLYYNLTLNDTNGLPTSGTINITFPGPAGGDLPSCEDESVSVNSSGLYTGNCFLNYTTAINGTWNVTATNSSASSPTNSTEFNISLVRNVSVASSDTAESGNPGQIVSYIVEVANTGNYNDTFNLTNSTNETNWVPSLSNASVTLTPGQSVNVTLNVTIAGDAVPGNEAIATVTGMLYNNASTNSSLNFTTTASTYRNVTMRSLDSTSASIDAQGFQVFRLEINNTGNTLDNITLTHTPSWWSNEFVNNSPIINVSKNTTINVSFRIDVPANVTGSQTVNATATVGSSSNTTTFSITVTSLNTGGVVQNATDWLEANDSPAGNWGNNLTNAWALWALNIAYGSNASIIINATDLFNITQDSLGFWTNNNTTALVIIAHKEATYGNDVSGKANLTNATAYLHSQADTTNNYTWPSGSPDAQTTAMMLTAIYKTGLNNTNDTNATIWLGDQMNSNGSIDNNLQKTAWALMAFDLSGTLSVNETNATDWIKRNQSIYGYFGDNTSINDTALAIIALREAGVTDATTWILDEDGNYSNTTNDQYEGSIWKAVYWVLTKRNTTTGGWGNSAPNALSTSYGIIVTGDNYGTVNGTITGSGNASGTPMANITVRFTSGSNNYYAITNGTGFYLITIPPATYSVTPLHASYMTNTSVSSLALNNGEAKTQNFGMLPNLTITGIYGSNDFLSALTVAEGVSFTVAGWVNYTHTGTGAVTDITITGTNISTITTSNANGSFSRSVQAPTVGANVVILITVTATDGNGSTNYKQKNLTITNNASNISNQVGGGGGGGETFALRITSYHKSVTAAQGSTKTVDIIVKNDGAKALNKVNLKLVGIRSAWYTAKTAAGESTEDLAVDESVTFKVKFTIPEDATVKTYSAVWTAQDEDKNAKAEKSMNLTITQMWTETETTTLEDDVGDLEAQVLNLSNLISELRGQGVNVTALEADLATLNQTVTEARTAFDSGDYDTAQTKVDEATLLITSLQTAVAAAAPGGIDILGAIASTDVGLVIIAVIVIAGAAIAGFVLWYKFFRLITIAEVKQDPARYSEGARIEGVIKSITDTKKGKVFLISDHTDKLHVRYPFYTTVSIGEIIRANGIVKTYKNVPYMDASDLARVSIKHKA